MAGRSGGLSDLCLVTDHLYLSSGRAANDSSRLSRWRITCIVNVSKTKRSSPPPPGVEYIHIPVADAPESPLSEHFDAVADKIKLAADGGGRTLVHCNAGMSRSPTLCMAYLIKHHGLPLLEAHQRLKTRRPLVRPNAGFWKQLVRYEMEHLGVNSVRMVSSSTGEIPHIYEDETRSMIPL